MTGVYRTINLAEAALWIAMGVGVLVVCMIRRRLNAGGAMLAVTLVLFGLSDVVETQTGAWWRPWWLLMWKSACVLMLVALVVRGVRRRRRDVQSGSSP